VVAASNKLVFREVLAATGLPGPTFQAVPVSMAAAAAARAAPYPCVLKPLFLNASRGVIRADSPAEFEEAFSRIKAILADAEVAARGGALAETVLVESYLRGAEAALEGTVIGGELRVLAVLDKPEPLEGPFFQETMFVTPSRHDMALQTEMARQGQAAVAALGLLDGPVHAEFRIDGNQVRLLELAPRSIGGNCARLLRFGTGETLEVVILRQALGIPMGGTARESRAAGVMMIPIPRRGVLRAVTGLGAAKRVPGIEGVDITLKRGQEAVPPPEGHQYLGFIYARAESPLAVEQALRAAHAALRIELD
jgi:biotin carboxylase